jgi:hypothetical protein
MLLQTIMRFNRRGPPPNWQQLAKNLLECILPKKSKKRSCVTRRGNTMPQIKKQHQNQDQREKIK